MATKPVFRPKPNAIEALFGRRKAVIGVIHSHALPGSPAYEGAPMEDIIAFAVAEAERYRDGGVDGLIVENHGDIPFAKPEDLGPETAAWAMPKERSIDIDTRIDLAVAEMLLNATPA